MERGTWSFVTGAMSTRNPATPDTVAHRFQLLALVVGDSFFLCGLWILHSALV